MEKSRATRKSINSGEKAKSWLLPYARAKRRSCLFSLASLSIGIVGRFLELHRQMNNSHRQNLSKPRGGHAAASTRGRYLDKHNRRQQTQRQVFHIMSFLVLEILHSDCISSCSLWMILGSHCARLNKPHVAKLHLAESVQPMTMTRPLPRGHFYMRPYL